MKQAFVSITEMQRRRDQWRKRAEAAEKDLPQLRKRVAELERMYASSEKVVASYKAHEDRACTLLGRVGCITHPERKNWLEAACDEIERLRTLFAAKLTK